MCPSAFVKMLVFTSSRCNHLRGRDKAKFGGKMHRLLMIAALGAAMLTQAPARADEAARIFGERAAASGMSLSPDGTKVAYLTPAGDRDALVIADVASGDTNVALRSDGSEFNINWCTWARAERLICQLYGISLVSDLMMGFSRIVAVNADGSDAIQLSQQQRMGEIATRNSGGSVENLLPDDPDHILMNLYQSVEHNQASRFGNDDGGTFLGRVNIDSGRITKLEGPNEETAGYFTDAAGNIRGQATFNTTGRLRLIGEDLNWFYRTADSRDWRRAGTTDMTENSGFGLEGFDESGEWLYFYDNHDGRAALYRMKADGSESRELVFSHPEVDVGSLRRIGKYDRPVGVGYTTEYTYVEYFDPKIKALRTALGRALPGEISIAILDESWDGNRKLIHAGSDTEPGTYYVFRHRHEAADNAYQVSPEYGCADARDRKAGQLSRLRRDNDPRLPYAATRCRTSRAAVGGDASRRSKRS